MTETYCDVRWTCPTCGRFIAASALREEFIVDPINDYYGGHSEITADCARCGEIEPRCVPVKTFGGAA